VKYLENGSCDFAVHSPTPTLTLLLTLLTLLTSFVAPRLTRREVAQAHHNSAAARQHFRRDFEAAELQGCIK